MWRHCFTSSRIFFPTKISHGRAGNFLFFILEKKWRQPSGRSHRRLPVIRENETVGAGGRSLVGGMWGGNQRSGWCGAKEN